MKTGPRGKRQKIVGEELIRLPDGACHLHEKLACGHFVKGVYNEYGEPCSGGGMSVETRICRQCLAKTPPGPPGEIVEPGSPADD